MQEDDENRSQPHFVLDRVSPVLTLFASNDLSSSPTNDSEALQERKTLQDAITYLDLFQEIPTLLDVHLEELASPAVTKLRLSLRSHRRLPEAQDRLVGCAKWIYQLTKIRGYKTIVRLFPHEVADLDVLLDVFQHSQPALTADGTWEIRYVLLLWLSLVCVLPFDLARWDRPGSKATSRYLIELGRHYLSSPGKERDAAAVMLGKVLVRQDVSHALLPAFLEEAARDLPNPGFLPIGLLQTLSETLKTGTRSILVEHLPACYRLIALCDPATSRIRNPLVRRYRVKLAGRLAIAYMPRTRKPQRRKAATLAIAATEPESGSCAPVDAMDEFDAPEEVEVISQDLLDALEDVDTTVRLSTAKHLARIVQALPPSLAEQILDAALNSFSTGVVALKEMQDLSAVSDGRWHGLCMLVAECARRSLIPAAKFSTIFPWIFSALHFDQRRGTRIIGSNVRDAAAYVVWSFARAYEPSDLALFAPDLARHLILVSLFDRELHIRRAASAAFQEVVGRLGIIPHGIALLQVLDYYTCGNQRSAFLVAAPTVAGYEEYRSDVRDHLLRVVIPHYDTSMRNLGALSLKLVIEQGLAALPMTRDTLTSTLASKDLPKLHGTLLALASIAPLLDSPSATSTLDALANVPTAMLAGFQSDMTVEAALKVVAALTERIEGKAESPPAFSTAFLAAAGKKPSSSCHEAAADAMGELSRKYDVGAEVKRLLAGLKGFSPSNQQCCALCLGRLDVASRASERFEQVWRTLITFADPSAAKPTSNIEARRNTLQSLITLLICRSTSATDLSDRLVALFDLLFAGLNDYTTDQRGDVGSWVRMASMIGLVDLLIADKAALYEAWPIMALEMAVSGLLKQSIERIDGVREVAVQQLLRLQQSGHDVARDLQSCLAALERGEHRELNVVLPAVLPLLAVPTYRTAILQGLSNVYGSTALSSLTAKLLVSYFSSLPTQVCTTSYNQLTLLHDVLTLTTSHLNESRILTPALRILTSLVSAVEVASFDYRDLASDLINLAVRTAKTAKTVQRGIASDDLYLAILASASERSQAVSALPIFLTHRLVPVREHVATALYDRLLLDDSPEAEALVLETAWADNETAEAASSQLVSLLA